MRMCRNCKYCLYMGWDGIYESCLDYEMTTTDEDEIETAKNCKKYEEGTPSCLENKRHYRSSTFGDYSPSNPWDAPGMSVSDFI